MATEDDLMQLAALFEQAGAAHHDAFVHVNGDDPDWPWWYAGYVLDELRVLLGAQFTRSELTYLFVLVDRELKAEAPGASWTRYYSGFFAQRYLI